MAAELLSTSLKRHRNTFSGFHKLPLEIKTGIFSEAVRSGPLDDYRYSSSYFHQLHNLAKVCQSWADIILGSAAFWTCLSGTHSLPLVRSALFRARDRALEIRYQATGQVAPRPEFLSLVIQHMDKWNSANLVLPLWHARFLKKIESARLTRLNLVNHVLSMNHQVTPLAFLPASDFIGHVPALSNICLVKFRLETWDKPFLQNLTNISLQNVMVNAPLQAILQVLSTSRERLEYIALSQVHSLEHIEPDHLERILFPRLSCMIIAGCEPLGTHSLLLGIDAPQCIHVGFSYHKHNADLRDHCATLLKAAILQARPTMRRLRLWVQSTSRISVTTHSDDQAVTTSSVNIHFTGQDTGEALVWLLEAMGTTPADAKVQLRGLSFDFALTAVQAAVVLRSLPSLISMEMANVVQGGLLTLFQALGKPDTNAETGHVQWLCPQLTMLMISNGDVCSDALITTMVRRTEASNGARDVRARGAPLAMTDLIIRQPVPAMSRDTWRKIKDSVGPLENCKLLDKDGKPYSFPEEGTIQSTGA